MKIFFLCVFSLSLSQWAMATGGECNTSVSCEKSSASCSSEAINLPARRFSRGASMSSQCGTYEEIAPSVRFCSKSIDYSNGASTQESVFVCCDQDGNAITVDQNGAGYLSEYCQ